MSFANQQSAVLRRLEADGLVAFPTETVWGLAANARSPAAVSALRSWKGRGEGAPVSVLVPGIGDLSRYGFDVGPRAQRLMGAFWPGPLTLILPCGDGFAPGIAREDGAVGVRCSSHPVARALASAAEAAEIGPVTATSLNRTGAPPACTHAQALESCGGSGEGPLVIDVDRCDAFGESPSTVVDLTGIRDKVLRWGALSADQIGPMLESGPADP